MSARLFYSREIADESIEELSLVTLTRAVAVPEEGLVLPTGAAGTVVGVLEGGAVYVVEFTEPFVALVDLVAGDVVAIPGRAVPTSLPDVWHVEHLKLVGYLLNLDHPYGRAKARVFLRYGFARTIQNVSLPLSSTMSPRCHTVSCRPTKPCASSSRAPCRRRPASFPEYEASGWLMPPIEVPDY